jgi:GTPase
MAKDWNLGDKSLQNKLNTAPERAILVGVITQTQTEEQLMEYFDELQFLAETAGAVTVKRFFQKLTHPDARTYLGSGKILEVQRYVETHNIDLVIFDDDLSGKQTNLIEEALKCKILDRSMLILDIFASRAETAQSKTQVELAQAQYLLPRLRGMWTHLERQRGGIGMRGPGEKEIETDRRLVREQIQKLKEQLEKIDKQNFTQRKNRGAVVRVSLVGYTNVGKSTLMNVLSKSDVFAENKLFATLDTTVRKVVLEQMPFLLSDTVGFIRKLPHHLVESFKSTLDEVRESDLLLHVIDVSHPQFREQLDTVVATLQDIGAVNKRTMLIFNKMDAYRDRYFDKLLTPDVQAEIEDELYTSLGKQHKDTEVVFISAVTGENMDALKWKLNEAVRELYIERYPHQTQFW